MNIIKKNVYYCDHCKKHTLSKSSIALHEEHCTNNPNRSCRLCDCGPGSISEIVSKYPKAENGCVDEATFKQIREECDRCPICTFSVMRQLGIFSFKKDGSDKLEEFDWKAETLQWLRDRREH